MKPRLLPICFALASISAASAASSPSAQVDAFIEASLKKAGKEPMPLASGETFVRRVYLDIAGRTPTLEETQSFLTDDSESSRTRLIDHLLASEAYVHHFYHFWADLLRAKTQVAGQGNSQPSGYAYEEWIKESLRANKPYDDLVRELLTAKGKPWANGAIGYYLRDFGMPLDNLAITSQVFLGTQIVCAQCHNHPFDTWTQMDYYHMAAFTFGVTTSNGSHNGNAAQKLFNKAHPDPAERKDFARAASEILKPVRFTTVEQTHRNLRLPHDYQYSDAKPKDLVEPEVPFGTMPPLAGDDPVESFAAWITSPDNPRFTKVIANRLWKKVMGVGIIEPVDDMRDQTLPSHPELLKFLESHLKSVDYDVKAFLRTLYLTKSYQREASPVEVAPGQPFDFAGPALRRLSAEQIWDSLMSMVVDDVDAPSPHAALRRKEAITRVEWIGNGVYDLTPEEFALAAQGVAAKQDELAAKLDGTQAKLAAARESGDADAIKAAQKEASLVRGELAETIARQVYGPGLRAKADALASGNLPGGPGNFRQQLASLTADGGLPEPALDETSMSSGFDGGSYVKALIKAVLAPEKEALAESERARAQREAKEWGVTEVQQRAFQQFLKNRPGFVRASDLTSPAPNGHFVREFGQSDRELVDNANDQASITQALALLNGDLLDDLTGTFSAISRDLKGARPEQRLETIYLTMLSRKPTAEERELLLPTLQSNTQRDGTKLVVWSLLNTRQFLFNL